MASERKEAVLTGQQVEIVIGILRAGKCELSKHSTDDYVAAAAFVFDNGLMFYPGVAIEELSRARPLDGGP